MDLEIACIFELFFAADCDIIYVQNKADGSKKSELMEVTKLAITINIYYTGQNGSALKFAEEMISSGLVNEIRAENGNIRYDYFCPMNDAETVLLIDSWENQNALDIHHASPMMEQIIKLREKYNLSMKVERYISDESGIPDTDKKYIRD